MDYILSCEKISNKNIYMKSNLAKTENRFGELSRSSSSSNSSRSSDSKNKKTTAHVKQEVVASQEGVVELSPISSLSEDSTKETRREIEREMREFRKYETQRIKREDRQQELREQREQLEKDRRDFDSVTDKEKYARYEKLLKYIKNNDKLRLNERQQTSYAKFLAKFTGSSYESSAPFSTRLAELENQLLNLSFTKDQITVFTVKYKRIIDLLYYSYNKSHRRAWGGKTKKLRKYHNTTRKNR